MTEEIDGDTPVHDAPLPDTVDGSVPKDGLVYPYLSWVIPTTHAPAQYHLGAILPALSFELARRGIRVGGASKLPRLWTGLIGASGHGKSTAHERAMEFVQDWYERVAPDHLHPWPYFHLDGSMPGILAASATHFSEAVSASIGIYEIDEFSKLLAGQDSVAETMCKIFDGRTVSRHLRQYQDAKRQGEKVYDTLRSPAFSGVFASTPSSLERVTQSYHLEGGLYSRILWFRGSLKPEELQPRENPNPGGRARVLDLWTDWSKWLDTELLLRPDRKRVVVPPAVSAMIDRRLFDPIREDLAREDDRVNPTRLRGLTFAEQITGIFALTNGDWEADEEDAESAINLVSNCISAMWNLNKIVAVSEQTKIREKLLAAIQRAGRKGLMRADLYRVTSGQLSRKEMDEALNTLLDSGEVASAVEKPHTGRPGIRYRCIH